MVGYFCVRLTGIYFAILTLAFAAGPLAAGVSDAKWKEAQQAYKDDFKKKSIKFKRASADAVVYMRFSSTFNIHAHGVQLWHF